MTDDARPLDAAHPWNVFVLSACARLGPFPHAHLSPRLASRDLGVALRAKLPLEPSEFLVGAIDHEIGGVPCPIVLTNRRLFWFERTDDRPDSAPVGKGGPSIRGSVVEYVLLPDDPVARPATGGGVELDLGGGRIVRASTGSLDLGRALAETLRQLGAAARAGVAPAVEGELARKIEAALPHVLEADRRLRTHGADIAVFQADLLAGTRSAFVTPTLVAACVGVFLAMLATGVNAMEPSNGDLLAWGANNAVRVALGGEWWRLPASVFLHGGLIHLAVNMWCLLNLGPLVERLYGNLGYAAIYLAAGVGGAIASMATPPARVSVGASGAIFGIVGALLAFLLVRRRSVPSSVLVPLRSSVLGMVVFNTLFGAIVPAIDQAAHMGGLATGFLAGLVLAPAWPPRRSAWGLARSAALAAAVAAVVVGVGAGVVRWRAGTLDARDRFGDFALQVEPAYDSFVEVANGMGEVAETIDRGEDAAAKAQLRAVVERLGRRGRDGLAELDRVRPADPELKATADLLGDALREQLAAVAAAGRFEETRDPAWLDGPDGFAPRFAESMRLAGRLSERLREQAPAEAERP
ncbi:rhomboid family protein [Paludisphaera soli]|uniref:rhomboid family protein n=1 Tax=Paludisphaera soli TaxID=2712865 RepID=UPI0013EE1857|nr:rhomboid family intramembrane serine protease [Paludisphaera soli]